MRAAETASEDFVWVVVKWKTVERLADDVIDSESGQKVVEENRERLERAASAKFNAMGVDPSSKSPEGKDVVFVEAADLD